MQFSGAKFVYLHHIIMAILMKGLTIFRRTTKSEGVIKLRFRLRDGRDVDLYHKSEIKADLKDLAKFEDDGNLRPKVSIYNHELKAQIDREMGAIEGAYIELCNKMDKSLITAKLFEETIAKHLHPEDYIAVTKEETVLERYDRFIREGYRDGTFAEKRVLQYKGLYNELKRYLTIHHQLNILPKNFSADDLMELRLFLFEEYKYVSKYPSLYEEIKERCIPSKERAQNTVAIKLRMLQAFYTELEDRDEIDVSPFRKLGRNRRKVVMKESYDQPIYLLQEEFLTVMKTEVPETLQETKDVFLLQCAFGSRIEDFKSLNMDKIGVNIDGIPYIHYLPQKTLRNNEHKEEIEIPIMKYALEIIKKWEFKFPILKYVTGKSGYNVKIRKLLEYCKIDRDVKIFDKDSASNIYKPLYTMGSSKLCRKTHLDMLTKVQVNMYISGHHKEGSNAVKHYSSLSLKDRFILMCAAYEQPLYKVDKKLNVIG